ncbi:hypothetical protein L916_21556 [Phytophthora nicotianae]|uniref:Uncharacterized protein n=1 Tax=Phytophthora nicotianae TaxID=4792 RepID=W2HTJ4_PHYNI|nr:hypothetical protein L916_21556 [Phytophthora nicotianae]
MGQDMATEPCLCVEVLFQLPSAFWASLISMKKEDFTVDKVEGAETLLEACVNDTNMDDIESLDPAHHACFEDIGSSVQTPVVFPRSMEGIEEEIREQHGSYLRVLEG